MLCLLLCSQVQVLDFLPCPGGLSQESQARLYGRIRIEATDTNALSQHTPAILVNQAIHNVLQRNPVHRVIDLTIIQWLSLEMGQLLGDD